VTDDENSVEVILEDLFSFVHYNLAIRMRTEKGNQWSESLILRLQTDKSGGKPSNYLNFKGVFQVPPPPDVLPGSFEVVSNANGDFR